MNDKQLQSFIKAADAHTRKATVSRAAARKSLQKLGIITKKGNLTKKYK